MCWCILNWVAPTVKVDQGWLGWRWSVGRELGIYAKRMQQIERGGRGWLAVWIGACWMVDEGLVTSSRRLTGILADNRMLLLLLSSLFYFVDKSAPYPDIALGKQYLQLLRLRWALTAVCNQDINCLITGKILKMCKIKITDYSVTFYVHCYALKRLADFWRTFTKMHFLHHDVFWILTFHLSVDVLLCTVVSVEADFVHVSDSLPACVCADWLVPGFISCWVFSSPFPC